jgi:D-arabinonate dehydratase
MKIKHIEAISLERSLQDVFYGGTYKITSRNTIVTRVELDNGVVGETFGGDEDLYHRDICRIINSSYRPLLAGGDIRDIEAHWERMWNEKVDLNLRSIHALDMAKHCARSQAIAAVDLALWDALGKALGQSVLKLWGGYRDKIRVVAIGGYIMKGKTIADLGGEVQHYRDSQMGGMKLKVGKLSIDEDIERTRLARKIGGADFHLCVDANQAWTVGQAVQFARGVKDLGLAWMEEPVRWHDQIEGNARVRHEGIPVNVGQGEVSRHGCRDLMVRCAVDILNVDATIAAGATEWRRIAAMASCMGVAMAHHEEPQVALHLLASAPHGLCVEIFPNPLRDPMWFDLPERQPLIHDGFMHVPPEPGFGLPLRHDTIEKWAVSC